MKKLKKSLWICLLSALGCPDAIGQTYTVDSAIVLPADPILFVRTTKADYDNDGDLDLLVTGWEYQGSPTTRLYQNTPSGFSEVDISVIPDVFNGFIEWGDFDNDGWMDLLISGQQIPNDWTSGVAKLFRNTGGTFLEVFPGFLTPLAAGDAQWIDFNNDGLLDFMVTGTVANNGTQNEKKASLFKNTGNGFEEVYPGAFQPLDNSAMDWGDYDSDGRMDVVLTGGTTPSIVLRTILYRNTPDGFVQVFPNAFRGLVGDVRWWDSDLDGDLDLILAGASVSGWDSRMYRNDGNTFTEFPGVMPTSSASFLEIGDYDSDGDQDLLQYGEGEFGYRLEIYRPNEDGFSRWSHDIHHFPDYGTASWGDFDGDGFLDVFVIGYGYIPVTIAAVFLNYDGPNERGFGHRPEPPDSLEAIVAVRTVILSWSKGTDAETTEDGLTYNIYLRNETDTIFSSMSTYSGKRKVVTPGNRGSNRILSLPNLPFGIYYWSVQSIDHTFQGSGFAEEQMIPFLTTGTEQSHVEQPKVSPNPFIDRLRVELDGLFNWQLELMDIHGRLIIRLDVVHGTGGFEILNLDGLSPGVYLLNMSCGATLARTKLVKVP